MNKRTFLKGALLAASMLAVGHAQSASEPDMVSKAQIIEALSGKDIVLDQPGQARRAGQRRREPTIDLYVQFTFDSAELMPAGKRQLDELAMALSDQALAPAAFMLAGHTDKVGDADYNIKLSLQRAGAVRDYLSEVHGIAPSRLQTIGYGFARLRDPQHPTAAVNRRVEVRRLPRSSAAAPAGEATHPRLVPTP